MRKNYVDSQETKQVYAYTYFRREMKEEEKNLDHSEFFFFLFLLRVDQREWIISIRRKAKNVFCAFV